MCGRFVVSYTYDELLAFLGGAFNIFDLDLDIEVPRYNIAPGQKVLSIISDGESYRVGTLKWGFVPHWSKDKKIGYKMINARSETIASKPAYRESFLNKRCLILADGFYEWKKTPTNKQPMLIQQSDKKMFLFAGLWSRWIKEDGTSLYTTTIITTQANEIMSDLHERMPVILDLEQAKAWVDPTTTDKQQLQELLRQYDSDKMIYHPVSTMVNNVKNDTIECMKPYGLNDIRG